MLHNAIVTISVGLILLTGATMAWMMTQSQPPSIEQVAVERQESLVRQLDQRFASATSAVAEDAQLAADRIREAADLMRDQLAQATDEGRALLDESIAELERLAAQVESGAVRSRGALEQAFSRAYYAVANHRYTQAIQAWTENRVEQSRRWFAAASEAMNQASLYVGERLEPMLVDISDGLKRVSSMLVEGTGEVAAELGSTLESLGQRIQEVGQQMDPSDQETSEDAAN